MKKNTRYLIFAAAFALVAVLIVVVLISLYRSNDFFCSLFDGSVAAQPQATSGAGNAGNDIREAAKNVANSSRAAAHLSLFILIFILILQAFAFVIAAAVFSDLRHSTEAIAIRLKKLENADLFLDLPLYFGLLGTVSSFIVMSFNPNISRLIAYSSTLVGIIFSVILRLTFQYPLRQALISAAADPLQDTVPNAPKNIPSPAVPPIPGSGDAPAVAKKDAGDPEQFAPRVVPGDSDGKASGGKRENAGSAAKSEKETKK